jgi:thiol-disulfide isomerase/thioredoxin
MDRQRSFVQLVVAFLLVFVSLSHALDSGKSTSEKTAAKGKTMLRSQAGALLKRDGASALGGGGNANNVVVQQAAVAGNTGSQAHQCPAENVEDLEEDDFTSVFKTGLPKDYFVYFFKPNEPNCEAFAPKYDCVGTEYKPLASTTHVAKFPASDHSVVRDEYDITVYPTLRVHPHAERARHRV